MNKRLILSGLFATALASSAWGATIDSGVAPWLYNGDPASVITFPLPVGSWVGATPPAAWIGPTTATVQPGGTYVFTLALGNLLGEAGSFSLQYSVDDFVTWTISNGTLGGFTTCGNGDDCYFQLHTLTGTFAADSILTATIVNNFDLGVDNPMGLLVQGSADANAVPEPSTYALMSLAGAVAFLARFLRASAPRV